MKEKLQVLLDNAAEELKESAIQEREQWIDKIRVEIQGSLGEIGLFSQMLAEGKITLDEAIQLSKQLAIVSRGSALEGLAATQERGEELASNIAKALIARLLQKSILS